MSVMIESTDELLTVLKKLNLKVASMDELRHLLATINAHYNPETARQKTGRLVGVTVPCVMAGAAAVTSFSVLGPQGGGNLTSNSQVAALALAWGACALVSTAALLASFLMTSVRRGRTTADNPPERPAFPQEPAVTGITKQLSL